MLDHITTIDGVSHPYINCAYFKVDQDGNTLIIDTKFSNENQDQYDSEVMSFLSDLEGLIGLVEKEITHFNVIDIRLSTSQA